MINSLNFQKALTLTGAVFLFFSLSIKAQDFQFTFQSNPEASNFGQVAVTLPGDLTDAVEALETRQIKKLFRVFVGDQVPEDPTIPSIVGKYQVESNLLLFTPRFDPPPGITYTAAFDVRNAYVNAGFSKPSGIDDIIEKSFSVPELKPISGNAIQAIYPSSETLPANLLRMYVYFNQPMGLANPHDHVWLIDEERQLINTPFVEITEGLWNNNRTRLTLFFHPGRVKRGVGPNMTMGTVLEVGKSYELSFDPDWKDALGRPIGETSTKSFLAEEAQRETFDPEYWEIKRPQSGTLEPVSIDWSQPLDYALAKRMIHVVQDGQAVPVIAELFKNEKQLQLIPADSWKPGQYFLEIDPRLEDLAGNTAFHLFDTATELASAPEGRDLTPIRIPFEIE